MALVPFVPGMRDTRAAERTLFMRRAIRSPRYGVEYGANICERASATCCRRRSWGPWHGACT